MNVFFLSKCTDVKLLPLFSQKIFISLLFLKNNFAWHRLLRESVFSFHDFKYFTPILDDWLLTALEPHSCSFSLCPTSAQVMRKPRCAFPVVASDWILASCCPCVWTLTLAHPVTSEKNVSLLFSRRLFSALLRGLPYLRCPDTSLGTVVNPSYPTGWVCCHPRRDPMLKGWAMLFLVSSGNLGMTEGRAAPRVAGQETLPPDWRMDVICSFGGNHCCNLYTFYNQEQVHHDTTVDVWTLINSLAI